MPNLNFLENLPSNRHQIHQEQMEVANEFIDLAEIQGQIWKDRREGH